MTSKQPTPPPKFNIQDQVLIQDVRCKVLDRKYTNKGWLYDIESLTFVKDKQTMRLWAVESSLTLASPSPPPKFMAGDLVRYCNEAAKIISAAYNATENRYEYKIRIRTGTHLFHIPEDTLQIEKLVRIFDEVDSKWLDEPSPFKDREIKTVVNEQGGKQSHLDARFDCIPPVVLRLLAQCLGFGARKYGKENWKNIPQWDHLNHAMNHINEWNRGNRDEPHIVNAMARLTFALWQAVDSKDQPDTYTNNSSE